MYFLPTLNPSLSSANRQCCALVLGDRLFFVEWHHHHHTRTHIPIILRLTDPAVMFAARIEVYLIPDAGSYARVGARPKPHERRETSSLKALPSLWCDTFKSALLSKHLDIARGVDGVHLLIWPK